MPAYFDTGFSVREPMWHSGYKFTIDDYPVDWEDAREKAGLMWEPKILPVYEINPAMAICCMCSAPLNTPHADDCAVLVTRDDLDLMTRPADVGSIELQDAIIEVPRHRLVVRDDTNAALGVVSDQFSLVMHSKMGEILESVLGIDNVKFETAGSCRGGAQVWALAYLDEPAKIANDDSETYPFIVLLNNHDGSGACKLISTSVRVVCWNTYRAAEMEGERSGRQYTFRHSGDVTARIDEAVKALAGVRDDAKQWDELATELFGLKVTDPMVEDFLAQFLPEPIGEVSSPRVHDNVARARKVFRTLYFDSPTTAAHMGTGLGLVDASVEYLDHVRGYRNRDTLMGRTLLRPEPLKAKAVSLVRAMAS